MIDYEAEIARREVEIAELRVEAERFRALTDSQRLAIMLHASQCRWNHTDGCAWEYEIPRGVHNWTGNAHAEWLHKADKVMSKLTDRTIDEVMDIVRAIN